MSWFSENYVLIIVVCGTSILATVAGILGVFTILNKQALIGDVLSHSTLPGVVLAYIITKNKSMSVLLIGAALSAFFVMFLLYLIKKYVNIKMDAGLALMLSAFFGLGQIFLQFVQKKGLSSSSGLESFIFGEAATMIDTDVLLILVVSVIILLVILLLWKELKLYVFDDVYLQSLGFSKRFMQILLTVLTVMVVTIGIRTVGVILMSALLISPGVAARQFSNKLSINALIAGLFGFISGLLGSYLSASVKNLPTGPIVVVVMSVIVLFALFFSPKRGLIKNWIDHNRHRNFIKKYHVLIHLYESRSFVTIEKIHDHTWFEKGYIIKKHHQVQIGESGIRFVEKMIGGK